VTAKIPIKNQELCLDCAMAQAGQLSSFFNSGLSDVALAKSEGARRNSNISATNVVVDDVHAQPITMKVERAASRADHMTPLVFIIPSKQRLPCRYPVDREGYR